MADEQNEVSAYKRVIVDHGDDMIQIKHIYSNGDVSASRICKKIKIDESLEGTTIHDDQFVKLLQELRTNVLENTGIVDYGLDHIMLIKSKQYSKKATIFLNGNDDDNSFKNMYRKYKHQRSTINNWSGQIVCLHYETNYEELNSKTTSWNPYNFIIIRSFEIPQQYKQMFSKIFEANSNMTEHISESIFVDKHDNNNERRKFTYKVQSIHAISVAKNQLMDVVETMNNHFSTHKYFITHFKGYIQHEPLKDMYNLVIDCKFETGLINKFVFLPTLHRNCDVLNGDSDNDSKAITQNLENKWHSIE